MGRSNSYYRCRIVRVNWRHSRARLVHRLVLNGSTTLWWHFNSWSCHWLLFFTKRQEKIEKCHHRSKFTLTTQSNRALQALGRAASGTPFTLNVSCHMRSVIIGNSGSGKTWLAQRLAEKQAADVTHLDDIFWMPGGFDIKREDGEVSQLIESARRSKNWIAEGVFGNLASRFLIDADVLLWLDIPWQLCKLRLETRGSESKAHMGRVQSDQGLRALLQWAGDYYSRTNSCSLAGHSEIFNSFQGVRYRFTTESEVLGFLNDT